jgi:catechol 2,3-dioxygenase-like lactoylglutathione lyase family enzyme
MIGHLGLNVPDLERARAYYGRLLPELEFEPYLDEADQLAYRPAGGKPGTYLFLYPAADENDYSRNRTGLQHLAFMTRTRSQVDRVYALVVDLGSPVLIAPREFPEYPPPYYATFWTDPFGFMLEAVCHYDRD